MSYLVLTDQFFIGRKDILSFPTSISFLFNCKIERGLAPVQIPIKTKRYAFGL